MALLDDLIGSVEATDAQVRDITTGHRWVLVTTLTRTTTSCGLAARRPGATAAGAAAWDTYTGRPADVILRLAVSKEPLEASVGVAAMNSLLAGRLDANRPRPGTIPRATGKRVVVAGDFPFTDDLRAIAAELHIVDWIAEPDGRPGPEIKRVITGTDIAIVSGSTIVDGTLEPFLELAKTCYTIVYGPSTPLSPILFDYGADQLVGVRVTDPEAVKASVSRAGMEMMKSPGLTPVVLARA